MRVGGTIYFDDLRTYSVVADMCSSPCQARPRSRPSATSWPHIRAVLKVVCDMSPAFLKGVKKQLSNGEVTVD